MKWKNKNEKIILKQKAFKWSWYCMIHFRCAWILNFVLWWEQCSLQNWILCYLNVKKCTKLRIHSWKEIGKIDRFFLREKLIDFFLVEIPLMIRTKSNSKGEKLENMLWSKSQYISQLVGSLRTPLTLGFFDHFSSKSFLALSRKSWTEKEKVSYTYMFRMVPFFFKFTFAFFKKLLDCMKNWKIS